ncbi:hypothetical protein LXL04_008026 [Taraxacum kok-saghyz]
MPRSNRTGELVYNTEIEKEAKRIRKLTKQEKQQQLAQATSSSPQVNIEDQVHTSSETDTENYNQGANTPPNPLPPNQQPLIDVEQSYQPHYQPPPQPSYQQPPPPQHHIQPQNNVLQVQQHHIPQPQQQPIYHPPPIYQYPIYQQPNYNPYPNHQPYPQQYPYQQYQQPPTYMPQNSNPPNPPQDLTLRQMMETDVTQSTLGIVYPANRRGIKLKSSFLHQLSKFQGLDNEDPQRHLKSFHMLTVFPFTLEDRAREWLFNIPSGPIHTWEELVKAFNSKFYPASRISSQRNEICGIKQGTDETFHDYWKRFNNLCTGCPQHQILKQLLLQQFYEGLQTQDKRMIDASSDLKRSSTQGVSEVATSNAHLESKILDLTNVVSQLVVGNGQQLLVCGVCAMTGYHTDMCPMIVGEQANVNAMGGYQGQPKPSGFQNSYNSSWKQNPNYPLKQLPQNWKSSNVPPRPRHISCNKSKRVPKRNKNRNLHYTNTKWRDGYFYKQVGSRGRLPSETVTNPRENVNMVSLVSVQGTKKSEDAKTHIAHILATYKPPPPFPQRFLSPKQMKEIEEEVKVEDVPIKENIFVSDGNVDPPKKPTITPLVIPPPFPSRLEISKKKEEEKEFLEIFRKIEINIPLLDAIKQIPKYAKFLTDVCTNKWKLKGDERF